MLRPGGDLLGGIRQIVRARPKLLRTLYGKPATLLALALTLTSALALPGIMSAPEGPSPRGGSDPGESLGEGPEPYEKDMPYLFTRRQQSRDNEVYIKTKYEWGSVESYEEETEIWVKAWDGLEMELEYERVVRTPDYEANLKWKVEIEVETEIVTFMDVNGNGAFDPGQDQVLSERRMTFRDIEWVLDPGGETSTFVLKERDGLMEASITVHRGLTEPDGTRDNEPWGTFAFRVISLCDEESTHMALKVRVLYDHPDYGAEMVGYLTSSCSDGIYHSWSFPRP